MTDTGQVPGEGLPENAGGQPETPQYAVPATPAGTGPSEQPGTVPVPGAYGFHGPAENGAEDDDQLLMPRAQGAWSDQPLAQPEPQAPLHPHPQMPGPVQPQPPPQPPGESYGQVQAPDQAHPAAPVPPHLHPHPHAHIPPQARPPADSAAYEPDMAYEPDIQHGGTHESGGRDTGSVDYGAVRISPPAAHQPVASQSAPAPAAQTPPRRPLHLGPPVPEQTGGVVRSLADRGPAGAPSAPASGVAPAPRQAGAATTGPEYLDVPPPREEAPAAVPAYAEQAASAALPGPQLAEIPAQGGGAWDIRPPQPAQVAEPVRVNASVESSAETVGRSSAEGSLHGGEAVSAQGPEAGSGSGPAAGSGPGAGSGAIPSEAAAPSGAGRDERVGEAGGTSVAGSGTPGTPAAQSEPAEAPASVPPSVPAQPSQPDSSAGATPFESSATAPAEDARQAPPNAAEVVAAAGPAEAGQHRPQQPGEPAQSESAPVSEADAPAGSRQPADAPAEAANVWPEPAQEGDAAAVSGAEIADSGAPGGPEVSVGPESSGGPHVSGGAGDTAEPREPARRPRAVLADQLVASKPAPGMPTEQRAQGGEGPESLDADSVAAASGAETAEEPGAVATEPESPTDDPLDVPAAGYAEAERDAVLRVMRERRDIRNGFRTDPIPHEVLRRVLEAAHTAPSVGHSQPWDFVVIRSAETRRTMHELATRQREAYAKSLPKGRAKQFKELKIEAILDTPVNIVVTADPTRGGRHTLGRHTQPQMAPYSSALAVENLWLAARAEGLGVGWVSFFDEREMVRALGLPEHLEVVAYLCVGYVDEFPDEPELMQAGWSKRRPLSWVVHEETYGRRALPGEEPHDLLAETLQGIRPLDAKALGEAWERQKRMTKPAGALGMLEIISAQLSGLSRQCPPPIPEPAAVAIFAGDHGVHAQGVTPWPQEVTAQMVANFLGGGAVCNAFAAQVGAEVCVVDVGVAGELPSTPGLLPRKVRHGTSDFTTGPALSQEDVLRAIEVGIDTARDLVAAGNKALLTGEMGIANTTVSAALISVFTGADPGEVTGRGTGINDEMHARKVEVVRRALELHQPDPADPIGVLAAIGGLEHAAIVGLLLGGASLRTPVILDGVSAGAAALVARAIAPEVLAACVAGHRSAEPGHVAALTKLGLRPLVDLDLRLGEGTGALLALPLVQSAARAMHEVATFDSAGVTEKG
ncbi:nicotinate-nucleotide--dimethylbenzimidazole phosphoribosyltransferase [Streptomyces sp. KR80]|uniref:nicotinate-nucleotide--dimethylbenzimidazole phosphoribosyltransferase n=1 Tax=Streptomyces sp. KR80 TaxID=3457426 RepID=UPI003FD2CDB4